MLNTYEATLQSNGQLIFLDPNFQPAFNAQKVLVTVLLEEQQSQVATQKSTSTDWQRFAGALKTTPNFQSDPLHTQQALRGEWR